MTTLLLVYILSTWTFWPYFNFRHKFLLFSINNKLMFLNEYIICYRKSHSNQVVGKSSKNQTTISKNKGWEDFTFSYQINPFLSIFLQTNQGQFKNFLRQTGEPKSPRQESLIEMTRRHHYFKKCMYTLKFAHSTNKKLVWWWRSHFPGQ